MALAVQAGPPAASTPRPQPPLPEESHRRIQSAPKPSWTFSFPKRAFSLSQLGKTTAMSSSSPILGQEPQEPVVATPTSCIPHFDPNADLPDLDSLPQDSAILQDLVRSSHAALLTRNNIIKSLDEKVGSLTISHDDIISRSAAWKDELEALRSKVPRLEDKLKTAEHQLNMTRAEKEDSEDRVKDLRMRAEESRRAIMRLQGEQRKSDSRRSVTPVNLQGWNPSFPADANESTASEEAKEARKSKRASILFGQSSTVKSRHVRTASGSRGAGHDLEGGEASVGANGLKGLRLGSNLERSPSQAASSTFEQSEDSAVADSSAALSRRSTGLAPPGGGRPSTMTPSPSTSVLSGSGIGSPILEEDSLRLPQAVGDYLSEEGDVEPQTAKPMTAGGSSGPFRAMQVVRQKEEEVEQLRADLQRMRIKLDEALEARRASDDCLKALKEFIGEGGPEGQEEARGALRGVKLPPLPTADEDDEDDEGDRTMSGQRANGASNTWSSKLATLVSRKPSDTASRDGGESSIVASTSGGASTSPSSSGFSAAGTTATTTATTSGQPSPRPNAGLAAFGSFFSRTQNGTAATNSGYQDKSLRSAPADGRPAYSHRESSGSSLSAASGGSGSGSVVDAAQPATAPAGAALNRLSTWFKRPAEGASETSGFTEPPPSAGVASPPFASLDQSTLQRVDLSANGHSGDTESSFSSLTPATSARTSPVSKRTSSIIGLGLGPLGLSKYANAPAPDSEGDDTNGVAQDESQKSAGTPPAPPPRSKDIQPNARAAKAMSRAEHVGAQGGLEEGPFVAPAFD